MKPEPQHHYDIFELQREIKKIYKQTGAKEILIAHGKVKYFYFAISVYGLIGFCNVIFSTTPIFFPEVFSGFKNYIAPTSFIITFIAIFITKKIIDFAITKAIRKDSPILTMNHHNVIVRYVHFKSIFLKCEGLGPIDINKVIQWRKIDNNERDRESLLRTPWFIPLLSVLISLAPFEIQMRIDISIILAITLIIWTLKFYVFSSIDENKNIDKFLAWLQLENDNGATFTNEPSYYFIPAKPLPQKKADCNQQDAIQNDETENQDECNSIKVR